MSYAIEGLSEAVSGHCCCADVFNLKIPIADSLLDVVVVDVNVLSALMVAFAVKELNRRLIVAV